MHGFTETKSMERGIALVIVLVLLAILTMLAIASASTATAELAMAGNEQYREHASDAASTGVEQALVRLRSIAGAPASTIINTGATAVTGSAIDSYSTTTRYAGEETSLPLSSAEKLTGYHYVIESTGESLRGAIDVQTQGVLVIAVAGATQTYRRAGGGLSGDSAP
jgi:Tfp pilus assembly protein PilX